MPATQEKNPVCVLPSEPSSGEIRFVGSGPAGSLDGVPDHLKRLLPDAVVDELLAGAKSEEEIVGSGGVLALLTKRLVERALEVELTDHLGYEPHAEPPGGVGNTRNGSTGKTLITEGGPVQIRTPRDRGGSFEPQLVKKRQRRFEGFDEKILALYSRGLSTREIERFLRELYGVSVSRELISKVTDAVMDDVRAWQARPLDDVYPVVFLDAFILKVRENGSVQRKACYLALGVRLDGQRDVLGMWFQDTEGAKFWMHVLVRHEALLNRVVVRDHHRLAVAAVGWKLRAARTGRRRGGWQAALTTTGLAGTARRPGSGKRDRKVYVRNQRFHAPQCIHRLQPGGFGPRSGATRRQRERLPGLPDRLNTAVGVATRKVCGVLVDGRRGIAGRRPCRSILW
jgi:hypothetical protein